MGRRRVTKFEIHEAITRSVFSPEAPEDEEDVLLCMALLHTHDMHGDRRVDAVVEADP
jgi:hypothetical protein